MDDIDVENILEWAETNHFSILETGTASLAFQGSVYTSLYTNLQGERCEVPELDVLSHLDRTSYFSYYSECPEAAFAGFTGLASVALLADAYRRTNHGQEVSKKVVDKYFGLYFSLKDFD